MPKHKLRAAVVGAVESTAIAARVLDSSELELVGIAGQRPVNLASISGYFPLHDLANELQIQFLEFQSVNDARVVQTLKDWKLDYLFVVGLSQLVSSDVLDTANKGSIGYHPTSLPYGRGRAPVAWLVLMEAPAASTLFEIEIGADTGEILEQVPFTVGPRMDARAVLDECYRTLEIALAQLLPKLALGWWQPKKQNEELATHLGKRDRFDGLIDWNQPARQIDATIRAAAPPHPGAYCYSGGKKLRVLGSDGVVHGSTYKGVVGKILRRHGFAYDVQCNPDVIRVHSIVDDDDQQATLRDGTLLRTRVEDEIFELQARVDELAIRVSALTER